MDDLFECLIEFGVELLLWIFCKAPAAIFKLIASPFQWGWRRLEIFFSLGEEE